MRLLRILVTGLSLLLATACSDSKRKNQRPATPLRGRFTKVRCIPKYRHANAPETFTVVKTGERKYTLTMNGIPCRCREKSSPVQMEVWITA
jgi:hypothetical protein